MNCKVCGNAGPADARFCARCGAPLEAACAQCSAPLPSGALFCPKCGRKVSGPADGTAAVPVLRQYIPAELLAKLEYARAHGGMRGERRVVTVLFCDVKGSTAAAEKLDPEDWAGIINGVFECLITPVYRYEGTLARLMGDAILAFFGAPIAHEDDPQRAVLAALDILQNIAPYRETVAKRWGIDCNVRVGINTGLVVVGEVGSDLRVEYTALGDAVNLASRMEQTAEPGTVQITENTHRLVAPLFEFEDRGPVEVKGKQGPVHVYRVLRAKAEPGRTRGIAGLDAPLIGREKEMAALQAAISGLLEGRGQVVSVMGEAGVGKSRLIAEARRAPAHGAVSMDNGMGADGALPGLRTVEWHEGRSFSYEASTPYAPFVDILTGCFALQPEDTDDLKYGRIKSRLTSLMPDRAHDVAPFLASLLGIQVTGDDFERVRYLQPPNLRAEVFRATCEYVEAAARERPVVLVFEDLHWTDSTSLALIEQLMPVSDRAMVMLLAVFRPNRQDPSWRFHESAARDYEHRYTAIALEPLDDASSRVLVASLLHIEGLPEKVRELILRKSEGNPFFAEEVIRSLIDRKAVVREGAYWRATSEIADIAVPDTITGVITARLDRLDEESRRALQTASVIGREFQFDVLAEVHEAQAGLENALTDLQRRGLLREKARLPQRVFMFKHTLTQETAYSSLLLSRRRELHRRVAECFERIDRRRVGEIGQHYLEAQEHARALPWLVEAGDQAARAYSTPEAIQYYTKALDLVGQVNDVALARRAFEGLGAAYTFANEVSKALETYQRMHDYAVEKRDQPMQISALNKSGFVFGLRLGQVHEAERRLAIAERLAKECQDLPGLIELHITHCFINTTTGRLATAMDHLTQSAKIGRDVGIGPARLISLAHLSHTLTYMRRFDEAWKTAVEARDLAIELGDREQLADVLAFPMSFHHIRNGELEKAAESSAESLRIATGIRAILPQVDACLVQGMVAQMRGEYEGAISWLEKAVQAARVSGYYFVEAGALCMLGSAYLNIGPEYRERTLQLHSQAEALLQLPLGQAMGAMCWAELGFCALALGKPDKADEVFQKGISSPSAPMYIVEPALLCGRAAVALGRGSHQDARKFVDSADALTREHGMKHFFPLVALFSGRTYAVAREADRALDAFSQAESTALHIGLRPVVWQARASAAQVLRSVGRGFEGGVKGREAMECIEEMAGLFSDAKMKDAFLRNAASAMQQQLHT